MPPQRKRMKLPQAYANYHISERTWRHALGTCLSCGIPVTKPRDQNLDVASLAEQNLELLQAQEQRLRDPLREVLVMNRLQAPHQAAHIVDLYALEQPFDYLRQDGDMEDESTMDRFETANLITAHLPRLFWKHENAEQMYRPDQNELGELITNLASSQVLMVCKSCNGRMTAKSKLRDVMTYHVVHQAWVHPRKSVGSNNDLFSRFRNAMLLPSSAAGGLPNYAAMVTKVCALCYVVPQQVQHSSLHGSGWESIERRWVLNTFLSLLHHDQESALCLKRRYRGQRHENDANTEFLESYEDLYEAGLARLDMSRFEPIGNQQLQEEQSELLQGWGIAGGNRSIENYEITLYAQALRPDANGVLQHDPNWTAQVDTSSNWADQEVWDVEFFFIYQDPEPAGQHWRKSPRSIRMRRPRDVLPWFVRRTIDVGGNGWQSDQYSQMNKGEQEAWCGCERWDDDPQEEPELSGRSLAFSRISVALNEDLEVNREFSRRPNETVEEFNERPWLGWDGAGRNRNAEYGIGFLSYVPKTVNEVIRDWSLWKCMCQMMYLRDPNQHGQNARRDQAVARLWGSLYIYHSMPAAWRDQCRSFALWSATVFRPLYALMYNPGDFFGLQAPIDRGTFADDFAELTRVLDRAIVAFWPGLTYVFTDAGDDVVARTGKRPGMFLAKIADINLVETNFLSNSVSTTTEMIDFTQRRMRMDPFGWLDYTYCGQQTYVEAMKSIRSEIDVTFQQNAKMQELSRRLDGLVMPDN